MNPPAPTDPRLHGLPTRLRLFLAGILGLLAALAVAGGTEAGLRALGGNGRAPDLLFVAAAALTPVLALGLLVHLVTAMTGRTRLLLREVRRLEEEISASPPQLSEETHRVREGTRGAASRFARAAGPFVSGLAVQVVVTETVAITCVAANIDNRVAAVFLGAEIAALFAYLLFFNAILARLSGERRAAPEGNG